MQTTAQDRSEYISLAGFSKRDIAIFEKRLDAGEIKCPYCFSNFIQDKELGATLEVLKLDRERFWHLVLFVYDFTVDACFNGVEREEGGHEMMWMLIDRGRRLVEGQKPEPLKTDASCTFRLQRRNYKVKDIDSISILLYWIHRGMIQMRATDPIWELNWLIDDYESHEYARQESTSVAIWLFASLIIRFFKENKQFSGRVPKGSSISLNKQLLISKLIRRMNLSFNDNFLFSDETLKGFLKQYRNKPLPERGAIYGG